MNYDPANGTISVAVEDGIATISLAREERLNAFTYPMMEDLVEAFDRTDVDDEVRAVIVTGRGRAFCAGADLGKGGATFDRGSGTFALRRGAVAAEIVGAALYLASGASSYTTGSMLAIDGGYVV